MSGREPVRLAVLGVGAIAQVVHLPILSRTRGVEVVGMYDVDRSKARTIADRFGVPRVYKSRDEIWNDAEVDGVVVCTPSHLHAEHTVEGLEAGKYVLCERPLGLSTEEVSRILGVARANPRLVVAMNQRFRPDAGALRPFVTGGELGDAFYLRAAWLNRRTRRSRDNWRQRKASAGGGALMDLGLQVLDLALWLLDYPEPSRVGAFVHYDGGSEVEDSAALMLRLDGGRIVNVEVAWNLLSEKDRQYLHLLGTAGSASLTPLTVYKDMDGDAVNVTPPLTPGRENLYTASYRQELASFAEVVRGGEDSPLPTEQETLMRIITAAYRSAREGQEVSV